MHLCKKVRYLYLLLEKSITPDPIKPNHFRLMSMNNINDNLSKYIYYLFAFSQTQIVSMSLYVNGKFALLMDIDILKYSAQF